MDLKNLGTAELAYLGDSVLELLVRTRLLQNGICGAGRLNTLARDFITAKAQATAAEKIIPILSEQELAVFKRAKNHKTTNVPKSASRAQYHLATALEALFAYLYLCDQGQRLNELFELAFGENFEQIK